MNSCNTSLVYQQTLGMVVTHCSLSLISTIACSIALTLMCYYKLYKWFNYRLVLYFMISASTYSIMSTCQLPMIWYDPKNKVMVEYCKLIAFIMMYTIWPLLLLTVFTVIQLFSLVVCFTQLEALERPCVVFSVLFPALFTWVPFLTDSYSLAGGECWIRAVDGNCSELRAGVIEMFALWYGPLIVILCACVGATAIISIILRHRAHKKSPNISATGVPPLHSIERDHTINATLKETAHLVEKEYDDANTYKKTLKEMLPLLVYPMIFFVVNVVAIIDEMGRAITGSSPYWLMMSHALGNGLWGFFAALTFMIHLTTLSKEKRAKLREGKNYRRKNNGTQDTETVHDVTHYEQTGTVTATHMTDFFPPEED